MKKRKLSNEGYYNNSNSPELESFNKNKKRNKMIITSILGILLVIGSFIIYKTYAFYEEKKSFNVLKGRIPDFGYDIKMLSVVIDDKKSEAILERGMYKTNVHCTNGTFGEWDYNNWNLTLKNVSSESKCNITFTSGLSDAEYNKYIEAGKALHRNTYRGKDITEYYTDGSLYTRISNGSFEDIYVGDFIRTIFEGSEYIWLIADIDNYLYTGDKNVLPILTKHHVTIIPANKIGYLSMNDSDTTEGGYANSKMATITLPSFVAEDGIIGKAFGNHILEYRTLLSNSVNNETTNQTGGIYTGATNGGEWATRKIDLMSEVNVFGTAIWSSSGNDIGIDNRQYAIFQLKPEFINSYDNVDYDYWLKNIYSSDCFGVVGAYGHSGAGLSKSNKRGVRPRFLIG